MAEVIVPQRCSEKACPFPAVPGEQFCRMHLETLELTESLEGDSIEVDYSRDSDEPIRHRVSVISAAEAGIERWQWKRDRAENRRLFQKVHSINIRNLRRQDGDCILCGNPIADHRKTCVKCREKLRDEYHRRRAAGLCVNCGRRAALPSRARCWECLETKRLHRRNHYRWDGAAIGKFRSRYRWRRAAGLCVNCETPVEATRAGKSLCAGCAGRHGQINKSLAATHRASGKCRQCFGAIEPARRGKAYCGACAIKQSKRFHEWYERRRDAATKVHFVVGEERIEARCFNTLAAFLRFTKGQR